MRNGLFRIIDANINRAREGLRVCEDITRFIFNNVAISKDLKEIRHSVSNALIRSGNIPFDTLIESRDTERDLSKFIDLKKRKNEALKDIFMANIQRVKESLRVLEECTKLVDEEISRKYRRLRFRVYDVEKGFVENSRHISCNR